MSDKKENKQLKTFVKKQNGKIVEMVRSFSKKITGYEIVKDNDSDFLDFKNSTGIYEKPKKPNYDMAKQWEILENAIPELKSYRESVREEI